MTRTALALIVCLWAALPAGAQPNVRNADLQERPAGDLARTFRQLSAEPGPLWVGYSVPAQDPEWNACCHDHRSHDGGCCAIEEGSGNTTVGRASPAPAVALEGGELVVLARISQGQVERLRVFSRDCVVDAGGRRVYWLAGVQPAASVELLNSLIEARATGGKNRVVSGAIMAIAAHRDPAADRALERLIAAERPIEIRKKAAFWASQARGRAGFELVRRTLTADTDDAFKRHAVFAISQSREAGATEALIRLAKDDESARVRGEALFWLAQQAGRQAAGTISDAIEKDPDTQVKERAVFALSQLPKDEGVPKLIEVARTNRNPRVRKQAMFWLGQSKDPRALKFFEEILSK